jgi:hypothetical protein
MNERGRKMKKIIYQLDTHQIEHLKKNKATSGYMYDCQKEYCVPSVEKYAKKIGAHHEKINFKVKEDRKHSGWFGAMRFKMEIFKKFLETDYDAFLFLDLDIEIQDHATDIFEEEEFNKYGFAAQVCCPGRNLNHRELVKEYTNVTVDQFYNAGVYLSNKKIAEKVVKNIPSDEILYSKELESKNGEIKIRLYDNDERHLGYILHLEKVRAGILNAKWNRFWPGRKTLGRNTMEHDNFHHYGGKSKAALGEKYGKIGWESAVPEEMAAKIKKLNKELWPKK